MNMACRFGFHKWEKTKIVPYAMKRFWIKDYEEIKGEIIFEKCSVCSKIKAYKLQPDEWEPEKLVKINTDAGFIARKILKDFKDIPELYNDAFLQQVAKT